MSFAEGFRPAIAAWREAFAQLRLLWAERLIFWATKVAPPDHPESRPIWLAALSVCRQMEQRQARSVCSVCGVGLTSDDTIRCGIEHCPIGKD